MKIHRALIAATMAMLFLPLGGTANAYEVSPMRISLTPANGRNTTTISVNNNEDDPLPIEVQVLRRTVAEDGTQTFEPAEDNFIVFPPQVEIPAQSSQALRVQYIGPAKVDEAQSYVVKVVEVPVSPPGFSGVKFTYDFGVAVYIDPPRATEKLSVISAERIDGGIRLRVRNDGNKYSLITTKRLILTSSGGRLDLSPDELASKIQDPLIPPHFTRQIDVIGAAAQGDGPLTAEIREGAG